MVVDDLDIDRTRGSPDEANAPSVVDSDAVLTFAIALQLFETVAGRNAKLIEFLSRVQDEELAVRHALQITAEPANVLPIPDPLRIEVGERVDLAQ